MPNSTTEWIVCIVLCIGMIYIFIEIVKIQIKHNKEMANIFDKQYGTNREESRYWVEKVTRGDGAYYFKVESNIALPAMIYGNMVFANLNEAIAQIDSIKKAIKDSEIISKEIVYTSHHPEQTEYRAKIQNEIEGSEPKG